jgi:hypothetical protein
MVWFIAITLLVRQRRKAFVPAMREAGWVLLAGDNADAAAPVFGEADAHDFYFRREVAQQVSGDGMEAQRGSYEINQRWGALHFHAGKIAIAAKLAELQMPANAQHVNDPCSAPLPANTWV